MIIYIKLLNADSFEIPSQVLYICGYMDFPAISKTLYFIMHLCTIDILYDIVRREKD